MNGLSLTPRQAPKVRPPAFVVPADSVDESRSSTGFPPNEASSEHGRALPAQVGDMVDGRFLLARLTATGGMGAVFEALDRRNNGKKVAVKVLAGGHCVRSERLEREAQVLSSIEHPAVVRYITHRMSGSNAYLAMEWLEGEVLSKRLSRGRLSVEEALSLGVRIADALGSLHERGIVHRDIKPGNVFLVDRDVAKAKILDLGLARVGDMPALTKAGTLMGTLGYIAPEQAQGRCQIDARADVFSLGCLLYKCLTGSPVFSADTILGMITKILGEEAPRLLTLCPSAPPALDALVARMLAKDPASRPRHGREVAAELALIRAASA